MLFSVQDGLIQMRNAPALWNRMLEQVCQHLRSFPRDVIAPGTKRHQEIPCLIKGHIPMHHGAETDGADPLQLHAILPFYIRRQIPIAILQSVPDIFQTICPDIVFIPILPIMAARGNRHVFFIDQHCLDPCRTEFDP